MTNVYRLLYGEPMPNQHSKGRLPARTAVIPIRLKGHEIDDIKDYADRYDMTRSDAMREMMGFSREDGRSNQPGRAPVDRALELAQHNATTSSVEEKAWIIDQMVRALAGSRYEEVVGKAKEREGAAGWATGKDPGTVAAKP